MVEKQNNVFFFDVVIKELYIVNLCCQPFPGIAYTSSHGYGVRRWSRCLYRHFRVDGM